MVVRIKGGYDTESGWPPDESTGVEFQNDVEIPGQFRGGGAGFGPGGFRVDPRITAPAIGAQGTSLSSVPGGGGAPASGGPDIFGPQNRTIPTGKSVGAWTNPFTDAHIDPATGQPEMLTGPGGLVEKTRGQMNPFGFVGRGNPYWRGAIAGAGAIEPTQVAPGTLTPAQLAHGPSDPADLLPKATPNFVRPEGEIQRTFPSWPTPGPGTVPPAAAPLPPSRPVTPTPATAYPQQATPRAAGPAAVAQQPNLGNYGASPFTTLDYRPNSGPNERNRGSPVATALDLSRLFGGGAPAAAPAAAVPASILARPDLAQRVPLSKTPLPVPRPKDKAKSKSSSTSQGGGY